MRKLLLVIIVFLVGCSSHTRTALLGGSNYNALQKTSVMRANRIKTLQDASVVGLVSIGLGSLALHDSDSSFKFSNEGSFGSDTKYAGVDKLGHAWYSGVISDILYDRIGSREKNSRATALEAAGLSFAIMAMLEVADGFAATSTGFSSEDLLADAIGASFSYIRNTNPKVKSLVDFRMEYLPNNSSDEWDVATLYSDQKYLLAWKLSGIDSLKSTPLRFFEIHTGYYARGFSNQERSKGINKERNVYMGLGLNLNKIFFGNSKIDSRIKNTAYSILEHIQIPYTYSALSNNY